MIGGLREAKVLNFRRTVVRFCDGATLRRQNADVLKLRSTFHDIPGHRRSLIGNDLGRIFSSVIVEKI